MPDAFWTGNAKSLAAHIPDQSVDLIFTDPVYEQLGDYQWLACEAVRVLRPGGHVLCWQSVKLMHQTVLAMQPSLVLRHTLIMTRSNVAKLACYADYFGHYTPCLWLTREPDARPVRRFRDTIDAPFVLNPNLTHKWAKPEKPILAWLEAFTNPGAQVWDPFAGSGAVAVACKKLARECWSSEIDPVIADAARERIAATPAPARELLPVQSDFYEYAPEPDGDLAA